MINGEQYATLNSVGGEEGTGWFEYRALGSFVVEFSADKPIYVSQYNPRRPTTAFHAIRSTWC